MVWKETFDQGRVRTIEVRYAMDLPLQKNRMKRKKVRGNHKGIWPQEANNVPEHFMKSLPEDEMFYFFDYYLTSGASWKGVIGEETVTLHLDSSWKGHEVYGSFGPEIVYEERDGKVIIHSFSLREVEPTANLFFALKR